MHLQFRVITEDGVIFERDYVEPNESRLGALTGISILEFQAIHPTISLLGEEVVLLWAKAKSDGQMKS